MENRWKNRWLRFGGIFAIAIAAALGPFSARPVYAIQIFESTLGALLLGLVNIIFTICGWITALVGRILDWTVEKFILNMATEVDRISAIDSLWQIIRDLGNIVFIFLILYAAINIILGSEKSAKQTLVNVVVVALFVNFSLFATKAVIDTSNVVALQFYENIAVYETNDAGELVDENDNVTTNPEDAATNEDVTAQLSNVIAAQLNLSSVLNSEALQQAQNQNTGDSQNVELTIERLIGSAFLLIAAFVMAAMAALITVRFVVLVLLMIASPLAFIAYALPQVNFSRTWWETLLKQSFFAPAMMAMMYITIYFSSSMKESLGIVPGSAGGSLMSAVIDPVGNLDIIIFYATVITLLIASLLVAKQMGAVGANKAVSFVEGGVVGGGALALRQTLGRGAARFRDSDIAKKYAPGALLRGADNLSENSFDYRSGGVNRRRGGFEGGKKRKREKFERTKELTTEDSKTEMDRKQNARRDMELAERAGGVLEDYDYGSEEEFANQQSEYQRQREELEEEREAMGEDVSNLRDELSEINTEYGHISQEELDQRRREAENREEWADKVETATKRMQAGTIDGIMRNAKKNGQTKDWMDPENRWDYDEGEDRWYKLNENGQRTGGSGISTRSLRARMVGIKNGSKLEQVENRAENARRRYEERVEAKNRKSEIEREVDQTQQEINGVTSEIQGIEQETQQATQSREQEAQQILNDMEEAGIRLSGGSNARQILQNTRDRVSDNRNAANDEINAIDEAQLQRARSLEDAYENGVIPNFIQYGGGSINNDGLNRYFSGGRHRRQVISEHRDKRINKEKHRQRNREQAMENISNMNQEEVQEILETLQENNNTEDESSDDDNDTET